MNTLTLTMLNAPQTLDTLWNRGEVFPFDEILDVRSPCEFQEDHIPSAINLPVLSDAEREEVGTLYQRNPFEARKRGAAYVSHRIGDHLRCHFADKTKDYRALLYCFRGGMRSASLAVVLAQVGWRVTVLRGGYKTYRNHVITQLEAVPNLFRFRVLAGATGTAKTKLLQQLKQHGAQVLDLEALAGHRGSILGNVGPQPSQKLFESRLLAAFDPFKVIEPVWVEAESHRVGDILLPTSITAAMKAADVVEVQMPMTERVRYLLQEYASFTSDPASLKCKLRRLESRIGAATLNEWDAMIDAGAWLAFVESLLKKHYDPGYAHAARKHFGPVTRVIEIPDVSDNSIRRTSQMLK